MSERQKQAAFLKSLLEKEDTEQRRLLREEVFKTEQNEKCIRSAMAGVAWIALLSLCGLCYEAVFVADFFQNRSHFLTRVFGYLALGSIICWVTFMGYWLWHRAVANRLYEDCRRLLVSVSEPRVSIHPPQECHTMGHCGVPEHDTTVVTRPAEVPATEAA